MNMSEPSAESLERALEWLRSHEIRDLRTSLATLLDTIREEERERAAFIASTLAIPPCPDDVTFASIYLHVADIAKTIRRAPTTTTTGE